MKNRWLIRHSCRLLAEKRLKEAIKKYFKNNNDKKALKHWKAAMMYALNKYMDKTSTKEEFSSEFTRFIFKHDFQAAIEFGEELIR